MAEHTRLIEHLRPGTTVAVGDGVGMPLASLSALTRAAGAVGDISLFLGWCFRLPEDLELGGLADVSSFMGGYALRGLIQKGSARYIPVRLSALTGWMRQGRLRPDVVLVSARPGSEGLVFGTEVAWMRSAVNAARVVLVEVNHALPAATVEVALPPERTVVVNETDSAPIAVQDKPGDDVADAIGARVAALIPAGAAIQFGPGQVGEAVLRSIEVPVSVDSGVVTDGVVDLERQGLLLGTPLATYLVGTDRLYSWADGRSILAGAEHTHDLARLGQVRRFFAVNTALEIDPSGQVNVEHLGDRVVAGVGGHADYALAASHCPDGLSILALPSRRGDRSTLVDRLSAPVTTTRVDIDVVVNEHGTADLRGLDDAQRATAIRNLWP